MSHQENIKRKKCETIVADFSIKQKGHFIIASHDNTFVKLFRTTIVKQLALEDCISVVSDENRIVKSIRECLSQSASIILFIEYSFNNRNINFLVRQIKEAFANVKIIILTIQTEQQRLILLHEIGADNFITKPVSMNTLIEKIANTIQPHGQLGKLIDGGKRLVAQGAHAKALIIAREVLAIKPNSAAGYLLMGDAYCGLGKKDRAVEAYEEACQQATLYIEPLKKLAELYQTEGDFTNQLKYLKKLDQLSPLNVDRKVDMGQIHVEMGNEDLAEELFEVAVNQARREAEAYVDDIATKIGDIYTRKNPERAEQYYRRALESKKGTWDKSDIRTFNLLGIALRRQGKWQDAIQEYENALRISPEDENLLYNIAMACAEGKLYADAFQYINKVLEIAPDFCAQDPILAYNVALIFYKVKRINQAKKLLNHAIALNPCFESPKKLLATLE